MIAAVDNYDEQRAAWIAQCAHRLRERFPRIPLVTLEETAWQLLDDRRLQGLDAKTAADRWLSM